MPASKLAEVPAQSFQLSLHIRHPSLDPREISRELQYEADESFAAGEARAPARGITAVSTVHRESYWAAALDIEFLGNVAGKINVQAPDYFIALVCARLFLKNLSLAQRIRAEGGSLTLVATVLDSTDFDFKLTPELGRHVSELGITINFEVATS